MPVAVRVTVIPSLKVSWQTPALPSVQLICPGALVTLPDPVTVTLNVRVTFCTLNVAVTERLPFIVTVHGSALHAPLHPPNEEPWAGTAVNVTVVPSSNGC
jgi:hypothetical protein